MALSYMVSQFTITFGIKSTLFPFCFCRKVTLVHFMYIGCFILDTSSGFSLREAFGDSCSRCLNIVFFTMLITSESKGTLLKRGFKGKILVSKLKWRRWNRGSVRRRWSPQYWLGPGIRRHFRAGSPSLIVE